MLYLPDQLFVLVGVALFLSAAANVEKSFQEKLFQEPDHSVTNRIVNGTDAPEGSFPYMVAMLVELPEQGLRCSGSLIAPDIVLTTASCVTYRRDTVIRTNPYRLNNPQEGSEVFGVEDFVLHPDYDFNVGRNNLGVVKLNGLSQQPTIQINPDFELMGGQVLKTAGWGEQEGRRGAPVSEVLQTTELSYITNQQCLDITATLERSYDDVLRGDAMCSLPIGGLPCYGDVGNPVVLPGVVSGEDQLVAVHYSRGYECVSEYPTIAARISVGFPFIRSSVCHLSGAPPDYFDCGSVVTASPTSTPILSQPIPDPVEITVQLAIGSYPENIAWKIKSWRGPTITNVPIGTYTEADANKAIITTLNVTTGETYDLILTRELPFETFNGQLFVFLGNTVDYNRVIADQRLNFRRFRGKTTNSFVADETYIFPQQAPTSSPSGTQIPSFAPTVPLVDLVNITVFIQFDTFPGHTSWTIQDGDRVVGSGGPYSLFDGESVSEVVQVEADAEFDFIIFDERSNRLGNPLPGNGICCENGEGFAAVYFGTTRLDSHVLVFDDGRFGDSRATRFQSSINATISVTPEPSSTPSISLPPSTSHAPTRSFQDVLVVIYFDYSPDEITWKIVDSADGNVVASGGPYRISLSRETVTSTVSLRLDGEYFFLVEDEFDDGLCCDGFIAVYLGTTQTDSKALAYVEGDFGFSNQTFVVSADDTITISEAPSSRFTFSPSGTASPTASATSSFAPSTGPTHAPTLRPSLSSHPSFGQQVNITVELRLGGAPPETGWRILRSVDESVVVGVAPGTYSFSQSLEIVELSVDLGREYIFEIFDTDSDGLRSYFSPGEVYVFLGTERNLERAILYIDANFGRFRRQLFVASEDALLGLTIGPTRSPQPSELPSISVRPTRVPTSSPAPSISSAPTATPVAISIWIQLDTRYWRTSWFLERVPDNELVAVNPYYGFRDAGMLVNHTIVVDPTTEYRFTIRDSGGDGLCCSDGNGYILIYLGAAQDEDNILYYNDGGFGDEATTRFIPLPSEVIMVDFPTASPAPSATPVELTSVLVWMILDAFPEQTGWTITKVTTGDIIVDVPIGTYGKVYANGLASEVVELQVGEAYEMKILDGMGDGLCCKSGHGAVFVYLGDEINVDRLLFHEGGDFGFEAIHTFVPSNETIVQYPSLTCFSGASLVEVSVEEGREMKPMKDLKLGDSVLVSPGQYARVYSFGHNHPDQFARFLSIKTTATSKAFVVSLDHLVFVVSARGKTRSVPVSSLRVGDTLLAGGGERTEIISIRETVGKGVYAPFTDSGTIVVDGLVASTFVSLQAGQENLIIGGMRTPFSHHWLAHAFESPHRLCCKLFWRACEEESYTAEGLSRWIDGPRKAAAWLFDQHPLLLLVAMVVLALPLAVLAPGVEYLFHVALWRLVVSFAMVYVGWRMVDHRWRMKRV